MFFVILILIFGVSYVIGIKILSSIVTFILAPLFNDVSDESISSAEDSQGVIEIKHVVHKHKHNNDNKLAGDRGAGPI